MKNYVPMQELPAKSQYQPGDYLVLFGELFNRGYANGLINEAKRHGLKIIYSTMGRRENNRLRPLTSEELTQLPSPTINIPLEAGFDLEPASSGLSPADYLKDIKMDDWQNAKLPWPLILESVANGERRLRQQTKAFFDELQKQVDPTRHVWLAHLMAGGVPRAKIFMATLNRVVKPKGDKFIPSEVFWNSELGKLCAQSFNSVTADTFKILVEESLAFQKHLLAHGGSLRFSAYGYHGTEILIGSNYIWQSYAPYIQGWAKIQLESYSHSFFNQGLKCCVYNCPEILTNSSSIFQGVEVPLYPLLNSFKKWGPEHKYTQNLFARCQSLLKPNKTLDDLLQVAHEFYNDPEIKKDFNIFEKFPQHNRLSQMQKLVDCSNRIIEMHQDDKNLITFILSEEILNGTGQLIFYDSFALRHPVLWLNHDIIVKQLLNQTTT